MKCKFNAKVKKTDLHKLSIEYYCDLPFINPEKVYSIEIKERTESRSLNQNSYLWGLISELADKTGSSKDEIYIEALRAVGAKTEIVKFKAGENIFALKTNYRAVVPLRLQIDEQNKVYVEYECFIGSSQFDKVEMTKLINYIQDLLV